MMKMEFPGAQDDGRIPMYQRADGVLIHYAQWYGYPVCCHNYFWFDREQLTAPHTQIELDLGFMGTGYRPCPACQQLSTKEVYRGICERRMEKTPFPFQADDFDKRGRVPRRFVEHYGEFIQRMQDKGIVLQPELMAQYVEQTLLPDNAKELPPRKPRYEGRGRPYKRRPMHILFYSPEGKVELTVAIKRRQEYHVSDLLADVIAQVRWTAGFGPGEWSARLYQGPLTRRGHTGLVEETTFGIPDFLAGLEELSLPEMFRERKSIKSLLDQMGLTATADAIDPEGQDLRRAAGVLVGNLPHLGGLIMSELTLGGGFHALSSRETDGPALRVLLGLPHPKDPLGLLGGSDVEQQLSSSEIQKFFKSIGTIRPADMSGVEELRDGYGPLGPLQITQEMEDVAATVQMHIAERSEDQLKVMDKIRLNSDLPATASRYTLLYDPAIHTPAEKKD